MSRLILNLDELNDFHKKTEENQLKIFDEILLSCHNKVKKYNTEFKKRDCLFAPPVFIIGKPPYKYIDLIEYLLTSLRKNGLRAEWLADKKAIYISWRKEDIDIEQYRSHFAVKTHNEKADKPFSIMSVQSNPPQKSTKKKKQPAIQHCAMLEYGPGAKDCVPINIHGMRK